MDAVLFELALAAIRAVPALIDAIEKNAAMNEAEKREALSKLGAELETARARVASVTFRTPA